MSSPRDLFTIIIPTRERCDTLQACLRTCLAQDYDNLEIIVSDNFSKDDTRTIVESHKDSRIRYINTGKRISQVENFEFGLCHAKPGYITFVGDDDGFVPDAVSEIAQVLSENKVLAISWKKAVYQWSTMEDAENNFLVFPTQYRLSRLKSDVAIREVLSFTRCYDELPNMYNSFVHSSIIERIKSESGLMFHSVNPDTYSSFAVGASVDEYLFSTRPYSVAGCSHNSAGASFHRASGWGKEAERALKEINIPYHDKIAFTQSMPVYVTEAFLQVRDHLTAARRFDVDMRLVLREIAKSAVNQSPFQYESIIAALRETGRRNQLEQYAEDLVASHPNRPSPPKERRKPGYYLGRKWMLIDGNDFGLKDVYDAALLCRTLLTLRTNSSYSWQGSVKLFIERVAHRLGW